MNPIVEQMKRLGLTEYEVKAYLTLLSEHPINGYALSKNSGIPRSRIYEILDGLKKKQLVFEHKDGKAVSYTPLEPSLLVKKLRQDFETVIDSVDDYTHKLYMAEEVDTEPKQLTGRTQILDMVRVLIRGAKHRIALSVWDEELKVLRDDLDIMVARGVLLRGVYFGMSNPYESLVSHRRIERYLAEKDERFIIVVIDDKHVISGVVSRGDASKVTWSKDPEVVEMSDDFIAHDVMINTYNKLLPEKEKAKFEHTLDEVRKTYYGFSDDEFELFPMP